MSLLHKITHPFDRHNKPTTTKSTNTTTSKTAADNNLHDAPTADSDKALPPVPKKKHLEAHPKTLLEAMGMRKKRLGSPDSVSSTTGVYDPPDERERVPES